MNSGFQKVSGVPWGLSHKAQRGCLTNHMAPDAGSDLLLLRHTACLCCICFALCMDRADPNKTPVSGVPGRVSHKARGVNHKPHLALDAAAVSVFLFHAQPSARYDNVATVNS